MKFFLAPLFYSLTLVSSFAHCDEFSAKRAWQELIGTLKADYAYLDRVEKNFDDFVSKIEKDALKIKTKQEFIDFSQSYLRTLRDPHLNLGPLNSDDYIVYPTGSDIYAELQGKLAKVIDVKSDSSAFTQGIRTGMLISNINGHSMEEAIESVTNSSIVALSAQQKNYAINIALGGKRHKGRTLITVKNDQELTFNLAASYESINQLNDGPTITYRAINNIGYIRFNNALGNSESVTAFRNALTHLSKTTGLIIDLRNTPSGGNTGVAEPILGHFTNTEKVYQLYQIQKSGLSYSNAPLENASVYPQQPFINKPVVVLAGRWTGSMGEGMTIGFDALGVKSTIGAPMADLLGGTKRIELKESGAWLDLGFERLYHVDGRFREDFEPKILLEAADTDEKGNDVALLKAIAVLTNDKIAMSQ